MEFSRIDRNNWPLSGQKNGQINDRISELEQAVLELLRDNPRLTNAELIEKNGKSQRTITRTLAALKDKKLIVRLGSNKLTGADLIRNFLLMNLKSDIQDQYYAIYWKKIEDKNLGQEHG